MRRKSYEAPLCEVVEIEIEDAVLLQSFAEKNAVTQPDRFIDGGAA